MATGGRRVLAGFLLALFAALFVLRSLETLQEDRPPKYDARDYVTIAYNLVHHGSFSLSAERPDKPPWPGMHRAPAYPFFLALIIAASPELRHLDLDSFLQEESQSRLWPLRCVQLLLVLATSFLAMALAWRLTRSAPLTFLTLGLVGLDNELISISGTLLSENLAGVLITALSLCLALAVDRPIRAYFALSGALLAALALTRPASAYLVIPLLALFGVLWLRQPAMRTPLRAGILIFMVCFAAPVGVWVGRNIVRFQRAAIATGGGVVLDIRSRLDLMTQEQWKAAFLFWARSAYLEDVELRTFDDDTVAYLDENSPQGAYQQAYARSATLTMEHGSVDADRLQGAEARERIVSHPWRHIYVTLPVALRGIYVHGIVFSVLMFSCLLGGFVLTCLRRDVVAVAALLPAVFSFAFHAFVTQNMPRFSQPLIAILWVSVILMLSRLATRGAIAPGTFLTPIDRLE